MTTLRMEEARYEYIKGRGSGATQSDAGPIVHNEPRGLIRKLEEAPDAEMRCELSWHDWHNAVWQCYRARSGKYPAEAWKQFVQQYRVGKP